MAGRLLFSMLLVAAAVLSVPPISPSGLATWVSLAASSTAFVAMALNLFLATRPAFLEPLFGGLDRMYRFHRALGITALGLILVHYFVTPDFQGKQLTSGLNSAARVAGEWSFYAIVALIGLSLVKRVPFTHREVPYNLWRQSHRFIGIFFVAIAFHQFFIKRPAEFTGTSLLANYLLFFAAVGIASFAWTQLMAFTRRRAYVVTGVTRLPAATVIEAKPSGRPIRARPGQFGFLHFGKSGLREPHPFTIAGRHEDGRIRFAIKPLGDFTAKLRELAEPGDRIVVEGGYGRFNHVRGGERQLWLAGGIGITPFLAMAASLTPAERRRIHLVHCVGDSSEAVDDAFLFNKAREIDNFSFVLHDSGKHGRIDADGLANGAPFDLKDADLWFCGPAALREAIVAGLRRAGRMPRRIEYERFEFR